MKECPDCDISVDAPLEHCPLCGASLADTRRPGELFERPSRRWPVAVHRARVFGCPLLVLERSGGFWWRAAAWRPDRRPVGLFGSRALAVKDAAITLHFHPELRKARD